MSSTQATAGPAAPGGQLLLISPPELAPAAFAAQLDQALAPGGSAGFLLRLAQPERAAIVAAAALLRPVCAAHVVAFLIQDDVDLALAVGADGVHLGASEGAACGASRHAAVVAGDAGADYIAFGDPARPAGAPPDATTLELIGWWSELFVLPCLVDGDADQAGCRALAQAGADLIGVSGTVWQHPAGPAQAVADLQRAIGSAAGAGN